MNKFNGLDVYVCDESISTGGRRSFRSTELGCWEHGNMVLRTMHAF